MAARIAAHVTVAYPQEAPIGDLLVERIREASRNVRPFRLGLGGLGCFEWPEGGVYVNVEDLDGGYRRLREDMLRPPFHGITYPPHVTLVHPQTSCRGREFWDSGCYQRQDRRFTVEEVAITAFDGVEWIVLMTCALGSGDSDVWVGRHDAVAIILDVETATVLHREPLRDGGVLQQQARESCRTLTDHPGCNPACPTVADPPPDPSPPRTPGGRSPGRPPLRTGDMGTAGELQNDLVLLEADGAVGEPRGPADAGRPGAR